MRCAESGFAHFLVQLRALGAQTARVQTPTIGPAGFYAMRTFESSFRTPRPSRSGDRCISLRLGTRCSECAPSKAPVRRPKKIVRARQSAQRDEAPRRAHDRTATRLPPRRRARKTRAAPPSMSIHIEAAPATPPPPPPTSGLEEDGAAHHCEGRLRLFDNTVTSRGFFRASGRGAANFTTPSGCVFFGAQRGAGVFRNIPSKLWRNLGPDWVRPRRGRGVAATCSRRVLGPPGTRV